MNIYYYKYKKYKNKYTNYKYGGAYGQSSNISSTELENTQSPTIYDTELENTPEQSPTISGTESAPYDPMPYINSILSTNALKQEEKDKIITFLFIPLIEKQDIQNLLTSIKDNNMEINLSTIDQKSKTRIFPKDIRILFDIIKEENFINIFNKAEIQQEIQKINIWNNFINFNNNINYIIYEINNKNMENINIVELLRGNDKWNVTYKNLFINKLAISIYYNLLTLNLLDANNIDDISAIINNFYTTYGFKYLINLTDMYTYINLQITKNHTYIDTITFKNLLTIINSYIQYPTDKVT